MPEEAELARFSSLIGERCSCKRLDMSRQDVLRSKISTACVSFVDYQVGRIIKALKDKGMYDAPAITVT